jgi:ABC-type amino acid transport system permease subunit
MLAALVIASLLLTIRELKLPVISLVIDVYLLLMRSVPLLVLLFIVFYGIPAIISTLRLAYGLPPKMHVLPEMFLVIIAFAFNTSATVYHNIRSALLSVDPAQREAAYSVGMTERQAFSRIVFPQAAPALVRPLGNTFIIVVKASAISFIVSCRDIMGAAKIAGTPGFHFIEVYVGAALIYWGTSILLGRAVSLLERRAMRHLRPVE